MSVYKRPGAETYSYDFECGGDRFSGDTGETTKRKAEEFQRLERARIKAALKKRLAPRAMAFGDAAARYMVEVGEHHVNAMTTLANLEWLEDAIGKHTPIIEIGDDMVARIVTRRRAEFRKVGKKTTPKRLVGPATVNRTAIEPLRKVLRRARKIWKQDVQEIDWAAHMLVEPKERVREASAGEEAAVMTNLERGYEAAVRFAFLSGCRRMEVVGLKKTDVDFFTRQFTVLGKGNKLRTIPMSDQIYDLLWSLRNDPTECVFTYAAARTDRRKKLVKGQRYPITDSGLREAMRRAVKKAGVVNLHFHDTRHTAATRVLRRSNIRVVQQLLGHERITTTEKYTHASSEDIRAALNAATPTENPTAADDAPGKSMVEKDN